MWSRFPSDLAQRINILNRVIYYYYLNIRSLNIGPQGAKHLSDCLKHLINLEGLDLFIGYNISNR